MSLKHSNLLHILAMCFLNIFCIKQICCSLNIFYSCQIVPCLQIEAAWISISEQSSIEKVSILTEFLLPPYPGFDDKHYTTDSCYASLAKVCNTSLVQLQNEALPATERSYLDSELLSLKILDKPGHMLFKLAIQKCRSEKRTSQFGFIHLLYSHIQNQEGIYSYLGKKKTTFITHWLQTDISTFTKQKYISNQNFNYSVPDCIAA